jgi:hypothetical protein
MRKATLFLALLGLVGSSWAADPIIGTWKVNVSKSKYPPGEPIPKEGATVTYREIGQSRIEMKYTAIEADGTLNTDICTFPAHGGAMECRPEDTKEMEGVSLFQVFVGPGEWFGIYINNGRQIAARHKVVGPDGNTIFETMKALVERNGKPIDGLPFEAVEVYERQPPVK